jgi:methyl acetate hydrolase
VQAETAKFQLAATQTAGMVSARLQALGVYFTLSINAHPTTTTMSGALDEALATAVREKRVPGIAAVALNRDGTIIFKDSWGTVNIDDPNSATVTPTTKMPIASMLKVVVAVAALQLVEQGKLCLDDLVEDYIPWWKNITVLDGFTPDGEPMLRPPKSKATVLQLLTHTAGPGYYFVSEKLVKFEAWAGLPPQFSADPLNPEPLVSDPGTGSYYGTSNDFLAHIVSAISGTPIGTYIEQHILAPLGIHHSDIRTEMHFHRRLSDGSIISTPPNTTSPPPSHLIYSLDDYATVLLALINYGTHPTLGATILQPSTVRDYIFADLFPSSLTSPPTESAPPIGLFITADPSQTNTGEFLPGVSKGWSAAFMLNNKDVKGGRKKGSGARGGIFNLYFWVDLEAGKLGLVFTNLLPFLDPVVLELFRKLEGFVYGEDSKGGCE